MIIDKRLLLFLLLIFILPFTLLGSQAVEKPMSIHANQQQTENTGSLIIDKLGNDPVLDLLGRTFDEIEQVLGEPDEQGSGIRLGPHNYIIYRYKEGVVQFCSPQGIENKIATTIIMGPGQEIYGVRAGMLFEEIIAIFGNPDLGPKLGKNNLYYMDYYWGGLNLQTPEVFISFSAADINGPTQNIFIKWEAYEYKLKDQLQATR